MIDQCGPSKQICLLNVDAQCNRIWVSQSDGLRLSHFQKLEKKESLRKEGDAAIGVGLAQLSDPCVYERCVRGCIGLG
jgi:hypothetical protein